MRDDLANAVNAGVSRARGPSGYPARRGFGTPDTATLEGPARDSAWRAMQSPPLSVLASNCSEHAHVQAVAILGYN